MVAATARKSGGALQGRRAWSRAQLQKPGARVGEIGNVYEFTSHMGCRSGGHGRDRGMKPTISHLLSDAWQ